MKKNFVISLILITALSAFADDPNPDRHQRSANENNARCVDGTCAEDKNLTQAELDEATDRRKVELAANARIRRVCEALNNCSDIENANSTNKRNK